MLAYLVRQLRGHPILIAGTCRDIELPPAHPLRALLNDLQREQAIETITVQPLSDEQIRVLVSGLPEPVVQHIQARAAGNPFFAEELARNTSSTESFVEADLPSTLPDTISAVLDLRLGRITSACHRMLVRAAVLGGSFEFSSLRAMESGPSALDEDSLLDLLEEALQAGMLTEEGSGTRITYHFWHPLLVSHLYDGLSAGRRASLHRRAAEVLRSSSVGREEEAAAAITYHLLNGGADSADIARYAELAGDRAYTLSAYPEAARHYRLAVDQIGTLPANASADECLHLANLLERLGECAHVLGNNEEARNYFERTLMVRAQYRHATLQTDEQYEAQIDALLWVEIGKTWFDIGDYEQAERSFDRAEQILCDADLATGPVWATLGLERSYILWRKGNFEIAYQTAHDTLSIFENILGQQNLTMLDITHSTTTQRTLAGDPIDLGRTHLLLGSIAGVAGQSTNALEHLNRALTIFEQYDRQREIANLCCNLGDLFIRKTEHTQAQAVLRRSLGIAERIGHVPIMSGAFGNLGMLSARLGDLIEAEAYFKRALQLAEQIRDPVYTSLWNAYLAISLKDQGNLDNAKLFILNALTVGRTKHINFCIGFALIALGHLHIAQAIHLYENHYSSKTINQHSLSSSQFLERARITLTRGLALEGLEAEMRTEGEMALAEASFLLGKIDLAQQQVQRAIDEARQYEQTWLLACGQRLLGSILSAQEQYKAADLCFSEAMKTQQQCGMRLEWARTMRNYGESLLQRTQTNDDGYTEGMRYLQEARKAFEECNAALDLELTDRAIEAYNVPVIVSTRMNTGKS